MTTPELSNEPSPSKLSLAGGSTRPALAALALLALALRLSGLAYQSLWRDEVDAVIFATRDLPALLGMFTSIGDNGPLYFLGLHAWIRLAGQSEFAIRFPSAVFGVLAVLATYQLGRELVGRQAALIAALLLAVSPYHVWYSQEAKMYGVISFLAPLSLLILLRAGRGGGHRLWLAWALLLVVFAYVHLFAVMMVVVGAAWIPVLLQRRPRLTPAMAAGATIALLALLPIARWLLPAALTRTATGYYPYALGEMVAILLDAFSMGLRPAAGLWPAALFAGLLLLGLAPLALRSRRENGLQARGVLLLLLYLLLPLLAIWLVSLWRPTFTDRYLIITLPAFFLLIACGVIVAAGTVRQAAAGVGLRPLRVRPARRVAATRAGLQRAGLTRATRAANRAHLAGLLTAAGLALLLLAASLPFTWRQAHTEIKADFRAATRYMEDNARPDDVIVFLMPYVQRGFAYYHAQAVHTVEPPYTRGMSASDVDRTMRGLIPGGERVWLFLSEADFWDPDGLITAWFASNGVRACQAGFAYIEVRCYDMPPR